MTLILLSISYYFCLKKAIFTDMTNCSSPSISTTNEKNTLFRNLLKFFCCDCDSLTSLEFDALAIGTSSPTESIHHQEKLSVFCPMCIYLTSRFKVDAVYMHFASSTPRCILGVDTLSNILIGCARLGENSIIFMVIIS